MKKAGSGARGCYKAGTRERLTRSFIYDCRSSGERDEERAIGCICGREKRVHHSETQADLHMDTQYIVAPGCCIV